VMFVIGMLLVKLGYSQESVAQYEYFLFIAAMWSFFWVNGLTKTMLSKYYKTAADQQSKFISSVFITMISISIPISLGLWVVNEIWGLFRLQSWLMISLYILFTSVGALSELLLLLQNKSKQIVTYGIVIYTTQLLVVLVMMWMGKDVIWILMSLVLWAFLRFAYSLFLWFRIGWSWVAWSKLSYVFLFALPLMGESLMGNAMEYIDGSLVKYFFDDSMFAMYRYGARELPFSVLFVAAIGTSMIPLLTQNITDGLDKMRGELNKLMRWLFPLSILLMLSSPIIFTMVYDKGYAFSATIFNIYPLVIITRVIMPHVILLSLHKNYVLLWVALLELMLNLALSLVLLQYIGVLGIPIASLIVFLLIKIIMVLYVRSKYGISLNQYLPVKPFVVYSLLLIGSYLVSILYL